MEFQEAKIRYLKTKTEYDSILREVQKANVELNKLVEEGKISDEEWAEKTTDNEFNLGLDKARDRLIEAEKELIKAGQTFLEPKMTEEQREKIKDIWNCKFSSIRDKVINILLKLET